MRTYEVMFIVRPDMAEEELDQLIAGLEQNVKSSGGNVTSVEKMGKRRLAYMVQKFSDGAYVLLNVEASGDAIHELERRMRVTEQIIKFITVRTDEEQKRLDKVAALRATKVRRSDQQPAESEGAPAPAAAETSPQATA